MNEETLHRAAEELSNRLRQDGLRIVFAESCTAGLIAATLARIPGVSEHLCGSAVVYRNATKTAWLGVSAQDLADESIGPVSEAVAAAMATGVLERTSEADLAASVTGHLGPDAPPQLDGVIYVGIARRNPANQQVCVERVIRHTLASDDKTSPTTLSLRHHRQQQAAAFVLQSVAASITLPSPRVR